MSLVLGDKAHSGWWLGWWHLSDRRVFCSRFFFFCLLFFFFPLSKVCFFLSEISTGPYVLTGQKHFFKRRTYHFGNCTALFFHSLFAFCANAFGSDCIMKNVCQNLRLLFQRGLKAWGSCCYMRYLMKFTPA